MNTLLGNMQPNFRIQTGQGVLTSVSKLRVKCSCRVGLLLKKVNLFAK